MNIFELLEQEYTEKKLRKRDVLLCLNMIILNTISWVIILWVINDCITQKSRYSLSGRSFFIFIIAYSLILISGLLSRRKVIEITENMIFNIRERIIDKIRNVELRSYERIGKSTLYNTITMDLQVVADIVNMLWFVVSHSIMMIGILVYLAWLSPLVLFVCLVTAILGFAFYGICQIRIKKYVQQAREKEKSLFEVIEGLLFGFKELKINTKKNDDFYHRSLAPKIASVRDIREKVGFAWTDSIIGINLLWNMSLISMVFVLPFIHVIDKDVLIAAVAAVLFIPYSYILSDMPFITLANISVERITLLEKMLDKLDREAYSHDYATKSQYSKLNRIQYKNIVFHYTDENGQPVFRLGPISLSFQAGETIFIIGGNGSGKSTLLKLLTGLYSPLSGDVVIDGEETTMGRHRNLFSSIFTDFHLFDRLYGLKKIDDNKVNALIELMKINDKVVCQEGRFSTLDLSTGQKKRLALVAAIMEDKPIYIFDEWAADQAPEFREFFYSTLLADLKRGGKTVICVTHDDRYFHLADRILKLELGRMVPFMDGN